MQQFEEMSKRWRYLGNTVLDWTGPKFEPPTSRSKGELISASTTGRYKCKKKLLNPWPVTLAKKSSICTRKDQGLVLFAGDDDFASMFYVLNCYVLAYSSFEKSLNRIKPRTFRKNKLHLF